MEELPPTSEELSEVYKRLFDFPYESLSPQAAVMLYALLQSYDPQLPPETQAQYSQIQLSQLPDRAGPGAVGIAQMRAIAMAHGNGRVIGHNLLQKHFLCVTNDERRIKQSDSASYPLPKQPTTQQN